MVMKYNEAFSYLESLDFRGIKLGLDQTCKLLNRLGDPHKAYPVVHVTGTNGKGSTSALIANIMTKAGISNGLYVSPHLETFRERIQINGQLIEKGRVASIIEQVRAAAESIDAPVTYFEFMTAMAFLYFMEAKVKVAIIEVGLGGRFDSTNVVDPALSIITSIGLDHQNHLGSTLKSVAREKSGIVKPNRPLILGVRKKEVADYIVMEAAVKNAPVHHLGKDFNYQRLGSTDIGEVFTFSGADDNFDNLDVALVGVKQIENASMAVQATLLLRDMGVVAGGKAIREGLSTVFCPGRFENVGGERKVILDGAHNPNAAKALCHSLIERFGAGATDIVFGAMRDKDYRSMIAALIPAAKSFTYFSPDVPRAESVQNLAAAHADFSIPYKTITQASKVIELIDSSPPDAIFCITGSFYTAGELRPLLRKRIVA